MKPLFIITFCCIVLIGCSGSSTNTGILQGAGSGFFSGIYAGTLELKATANVIGTSPKYDNELAAVEIEITENGTVHLSIDEMTLYGVVDDDGNWELAITINGFGSLIDSDSKRTLKTAGCPLGKKFAKFKGKVTPPTMSGQVSGNLSCKVLLVTVGTLEVLGTLTATMKQ